MIAVIDWLSCVCFGCHFLRGPNYHQLLDDRDAQAEFAAIVHFQQLALPYYEELILDPLIAEDLVHDCEES